MPFLSAIIPAAVSLIGGAMSSGATSDAANTAASATNHAADLQYQMWQQNKADVAPWLNTGNLALSQLATYLGLAAPPGSTAPAGGNAMIAAPNAAPNPGTTLPGSTNTLSGPPQRGQSGWYNGNYYEDGQFVGGFGIPQSMLPQTATPGVPTPRETGMGMTGSNALAAFGGNPNDPNFGMLTRQFTPGDLTKDPGYEFRLTQGLDAIKNQASALGGVNSGATLKALSDYAQGQASSEYNNAFNRWNTTLNNIFSRLSTVAGTGANSALQMAGIGSNVAANAGSLVSQAGQFAGAGQLGSANALAAGIQGAGPSLQQLFQNMGGSSGTPPNPYYSDAGVGTITGADASLFW